MSADLWVRSVILAKNFLRFDPRSRAVLSRVLALRDAAAPKERADDLARSAGRLAQAARICPSPRLLARLEARLRARLDRIDPRLLDWDALWPGSGPRAIKKGIILKRPAGPREKGVVFIAFEDQWLRLLRHADLDRLSRRYHLVVAPSWSPPHDVPFLLAARMWPGPLFHTVSRFEDLPVFPRLSDNVVPIPLLASNWVDPRVFEVRSEVAQEFDVVVFANFAWYKRHFLLFDALRHMPPTTRVLLLGRSLEGRTAETLRAEARAFGVADRLTIREGVPDSALGDALRSARISLILSGNEGACVAIVESLFADVPVGVCADAIIGSKAFLNAQTGRLLDRRRLPEQLQEFFGASGTYAPRRWALENGCSYKKSSRTLNAAIRSRALEQGEEWTTDLVPLHWRPNPAYLCAEDAHRIGSATYKDFEQRYGIPVQGPLEAYASETVNAIPCSLP